jgi:hypothetical protein
MSQRTRQYFFLSRQVEECCIPELDVQQNATILLRMADMEDSGVRQAFHAAYTWRVVANYALYKNDPPGP